MVTRTVITDTETLHSLTSGVVYNPFDRRLHIAGCKSIGLMRASSSSPKWHFTRHEDAQVFLADHRAARPGGKEWRPAACCLGALSVSARERQEPPPTPTTSQVAVSAGGREPVLHRLGDGFEVWSDEVVRNESKSASTAGAVRRLISGEIRRLPPPAGRLLHTAYAGARWRGTDVENLLFNNIDQTLSLFAVPGRHGVRFEDLGGEVPNVPDGTARSSYYAYRFVDAREAFTGVEIGELACRIPEVVVPDGPARLAARVWLAARRARPSACIAVPAPDPYMLRISTHGFPAATTLKAIIDGASAALQQGIVTDQLHAAVHRLEALVAADYNELLTLVTAPGAPLGAATQLFALDRDAQVRVTPDDHRCVAAQIVAVDDSEPARLAVDLHAARSR